MCMHRTISYQLQLALLDLCVRIIVYGIALTDAEHFDT
jgi:hypothetical protein